MAGGKRYALVVAGTLCVVLGAVGVVLPVLPTTPFLLLAAALYARSSPRFYHWLLDTRLLGEYIRNYRSRRGIPLRTKVLVLGFLWATIGYSAWMVVAQGWVRLVLLAIAVGVTVHLAAFPTYRPSRVGNEERPPGEP
ncbi:MAG: DUF454 domain-containing protein [Chloroflexi bacterium]|nr:DUF454 domain-containing protein [Chloroflexota bacterium]